MDNRDIQAINVQHLLALQALSGWDNVNYLISTGEVRGSALQEKNGDKLEINYSYLQDTNNTFDDIYPTSVDYA